VEFNERVFARMILGGLEIKEIHNH
jgi:hypothetical protein